MSKNERRKLDTIGVADTCADSVAPRYGIAGIRDAQRTRHLLIMMGGVLTAGLEDLTKPWAPDEEVWWLRDVAAALLLLGKGTQAEKAITRGKRVLARKENLTSFDQVALSCLDKLRVDPAVEVQHKISVKQKQISVGSNTTPTISIDLESMLQTSATDNATEAKAIASPSEHDIRASIESLLIDKVALYLRVTRLQDALDDARRFDGDAFAQLPPTKPPVSFVQNHLVKDSEKPTGVREHTGWVDLTTNSIYADFQIKRFLNNGYGSLHELGEFVESRCNYLVDRWNHVGEELDPVVTSALKKLIELMVSVRASAAMNDYRRKALAASKGEIAQQTDSMLSGTLNSPAIDHAFDRDDLSRETRERLLPERPLWAWSGNEVTRPAPDEIDEAYSRDVDRLVLQLLSPQGEEVMGVIGRLSLRLWAARPDPATYVQAQPPPETRVFIVAGDPSPGRERVYRPTPHELDQVFAHSLRGVDAAGSASDDLFELPAGRVMILPRGEEAYLRGCGFLITRDRRLKGWDWRGELGRPLPVGGVIEAAGNQWKSNDGSANYSAVPLNGAQYYRGNRWCNRDGSGTLFDETAYEWEDRRDRMRSTFWKKLHGAVQHRPAFDIKSIVSPTLHPSEWAFFFWTLIGHYMSADDWRMRPGQWRWPGVGSPERDTPVQSALHYLVRPESWPTEWADLENHDRMWANNFFPEELLMHPAMRDALQYSQHPGEPPVSFHETWLRQMQKAVQEMDTPTETDRAGAPTAHRKAFEALKSDALDGKSLVNWWKDVVSKVDFDARQRATWRAEVDQHRRWMREHSLIAYIPDPEGTGPLDGPDARIVVEPWSHDFMPEALAVPAAFDIDVSCQVAHDFQKDVDQGNGEPGKPASFLHPNNTIKRSLPKVERRIRESEIRQAGRPVIRSTGKQWLGASGPDDLPSVILAEAKANDVHDAQSVRRMEAIYDEVERLLESPQGDFGLPRKYKDV